MNNILKVGGKVRKIKQISKPIYKSPKVKKQKEKREMKNKQVKINYPWQKLLVKTKII